MGKNKYVGHRYIPIFENGWDKTRIYEPLTFVYYEGKTYVTRQLVPTNIEIENNDYWAFFMDNAPQIFTPTFTGQWEDKPYEPLSIVVNNGNTYVSKQNVPVGTLLTDTTYWLDLSTYYNQLFTGYEAAEQERKQAEAIRVQNENQRESDHTNRSVELAGKADKVVLKNSVKNGDFSNGLTGWDAGNVTLTVANKVATCTVDTLTPYARLFQTFEGDSQGDVMYVTIKIKPKYANVAGIRNGNINYGSITPVPNIWNRISSVFTEDVNTIRTYWFHHSTATQYAVGDTYQHTEPIVINLTKTFGSGNEPTKEEMDELIKVTGYIDGEYALNNKEMLVWTLSLIRLNKNAVIALGGTI